VYTDPAKDKYIFAPLDLQWRLFSCENMAILFSRENMAIRSGVLFSRENLEICNGF